MRLALLSLLTLPVLPALAAIPFTGGVYKQDFDSLGRESVQWADNSTLKGWYAYQSSTKAPPTILHLPGAAGNEANIAARGRWYNFGLDGDRALGVCPSTKPTGNTHYGVALVNETGATIHEATVTFVWERWFTSEIRVGHNQTLTLSYSATATSLVHGAYTLAEGAEVVFTVQNSGGDMAWFPAAAEDPRRVLLKNLNWAPGATLWLRFTDVNEMGIDHGVGIDDFVLAPSR